MDSLIVDLDKVLDDFEAEESTNKIPGKTSLEYSHFLAKHDDHSWEEVSLAPVGSAPNWKISKREVSSVDYGEPYEPTSHFDLSEADFAPSVLKQPDKFSSKLENVLTNGYDDLLKPKHDSYDDHEKMSTDPVRSGTLPCNNETMPLDPVRSGSLPCNNETMTINGFVDSLSASLSMHNSQMIDLHGCNTEAMTTNSGTNALANSGFDDTYCKVPIQVVDVFTPVSEEPQMSGFTTHEQSLLQNRLDLSKCSYKDTIEDNININFHETVPLHGVLESETSETVVSDEVGVQLCDGGSFNKENIGSLEIKQNCLGLNNEISLQIRNNHDNGMESHMQQVNKDNKKMDEGYDSYDCLGKDTQNDVTLMLREGQSMHPCPQTSDEHPSEHKTVFDHDKSFDQSTVVKPNEEIIEGSALNDACLEKVSNKDLDISLDDENDSKGVGFGQNIKVDDDDMDEYLKDIETPETSLNISNAHLSLNRLNDVHSFPSNFSLTEGELCVKRKRACEGTTNELEGEQIKVFAKDSELSGDSSKHEEDNCDQDNRTDWNSNTSHHNALNIQNICMLSVDGVIHNDSNNGLEPKDSVEQSLHDLKNNTSDEGKCIGQSCSDSKIEVLQEELERDKSISSQCDINIADSICDQTGRENSDWTDETTVMRRNFQPGISSDISRPRSWGPSGSDTLPITQQKRPNSLNLPQRGDFNLPGERSQVPYTFPYLTEDTESVSSDMVQNNIVYTEEIQASGGEPVEEGCEENTPLSDPLSPEAFPQETPLGQSSPMWIPDNEAPVCMGCETKFTFTKRRHHCRACGKVFCSACCNLKSRLQYMEYREARVCVECHRQITIAKLSSQTSGSPNPNNPSEYCSVIPPSQQASASSQPPSVLVPASALKREGSNKQSNEGKHVMFSDGIRPGGDLTELDGSDTANQLPPRRSGRGQKKVEKRSLDTAHRQVIRKLRSREVKRHLCLIPERGLPPIIKSADVKGDYTMEENPEIEKTLSQVKDKEAEPVMFALNSNLFVLVKILNLDCCVNRTCWCFTTKGMCNVGQDEIVFVLEVFQNEETIPMDVLRHFVYLYEEASKGMIEQRNGNTVTHMGHTIFNQSFLDSRDHGGILYIRPTFQCLHKVLLPTPPYVFGILLQKWEIPWAKVFPLRLLLRLGAEYRYYPCPLISVRDRKPVFFEIGHTIMNLLADFRNFQYMLPQIKGVSIHMEDKKTAINFPRNRYDDLMKVVSNSNEHVMALGASFSLQADSHLVCIQNDDGNYQTQAINIQNKPRKVTGASFVVFNGALKTSSGLKAKTSIVEDGLMVQITPESMVALKQAMKDMNNYTIECGSVTTANPDEVVSVIWGSDDKNINIGVKSPIDDMSMDGVESIQIPNATDYIGEKQIIRWTDVYFIQNKDSGSTRWEPVDLSRLAETLSNATCIALTPHLEKLKDASLTKIGLRVNIEIEKVGYEIGANGERLPALYMNDLDNELIPVIHSAASQNRGGTIILELIFHIIV